MKKTLVALAVTAFATSASAITVYENEGTKVDFEGSLRVFVQNESVKTNNVKMQRAHTGLVNDGSRFGIRVKHNINDDFYALAHYETRFHNDAENQSNWGTVVTNKAYVGLGGLGHEVTFGKQNVIGDEIGLAGYDKHYDVGSANIGFLFPQTNSNGDLEVKRLNSFGNILTASSDSAINYKYTGIKGLTLGANYNFANNRDHLGEVENGKTKSGFGFGAVYTFDIAEGQSLTASAGYTHDDYKVAAGAPKKDKDGIYFGLKYKLGAFDVAVDGGRGFTKEGVNRAKLNFVRTGASYAITPELKAYANYSYGTHKQSVGGFTYAKGTAHQYMLGSSYQVHKNVETFVEGRIIRNKATHVQSPVTAKQTEKAVGVGLRVNW